MLRTTLVSIAVACALALPATALAQSAGDNQYQDPLATPNSSTKHSSGGGSGSTGTAPSQGGSSGSTSGAGSSGTAGASSSGTTSASGAAATGSGLPRTGGHPLPLALAGVALLGAGLGVRRLGVARG